MAQPKPQWEIDAEKTLEVLGTEPIAEYLSDIQQLDKLKSTNKRFIFQRAEPKRRFTDPDSVLLYRWDRRDGLDKGGPLNRITGTSWWENRDLVVKSAVPLANPSFGDDSVYVSGSKRGSIGFMDGEVKRSFIKQVDDGKTSEGLIDIPEAQTYHLYQIKPTRAQLASLIDYQEFSAKGRTPPSTDAQRVELFTNRPQGFEALMSSKFLNQKMTPAVHRRFMQMMTTASPAYTRPFSMYTDSDEQYRLQAGKYVGEKAVRPNVSIQELKDALKDTATYNDKLRALAFVATDAADLHKRLAIAHSPAHQTDEVQIQGPIHPSRVRKLGSYTLDPNDPHINSQRENARDRLPIEEDTRITEIVDRGDAPWDDSD